MFKGIRKYAITTKEDKVAITVLVVIAVFFALYQAMPAFANFVEGVVVSGTPGYDDEDSPPTVRTLSATGVRMDGSGTHATLNGSLDDLSTPPVCDVWFQWGYDTGYGNTVGLETGVAKTGTHSFALSGYDPTERVHFRFFGENTDGRSYGDDQSFYVTGGVADGYRLVANTPLVFTSMAVVVLVGSLVTGSFSLLGLMTMGVFIYMFVPMLAGMQSMIRALWGG